jgi:glucose/arabinose dehydrogenase
VRLLVLGACLLLCAAACGQPAGTPSRSAPGSLAPGPSPSRTAPVGPSGSAPAPASASASPSSAPFDPSRIAVGFQPVVDGLDAPLAIVNAGDGSGRLFVAEQTGQIRIVRDGRLVDQPFLDIAGRITSGGERGLLGVAFHPNYPDDPRVFVDYTDTNGDTQVSAFRVDPASPDRLDPATEQRILFAKQPYANHNGGAVVFGPDGFLYISLGDGGSGGDPHGNGQSLKVLLGKILRIDVDRTTGDRAYGIPPNNPFAAGNDDGLAEIWLTGLRNPWRISFDRANGDLWIGDVGQGAWEEIDVQRAGSPGGTNFGWNRLEGAHCYQPAKGCEDPGLTLPVAEYGHDQGCTVIGGNVDRGPSQPLLAGGYVFGDYCSGRVWAIDPAIDGPRQPTVVADTGHSFSAFGEDEAGDLYAVDISEGTLLRLTATRR